MLVTIHKKWQRNGYYGLFNVMADVMSEKDPTIFHHFQSIQLECEKYTQFVLIIVSSSSPSFTLLTCSTNQQTSFERPTDRPFNKRMKHIRMIQIKKFAVIISSILFSICPLFIHSFIAIHVFICVFITVSVSLCVISTLCICA